MDFVNLVNYKIFMDEKLKNNENEAQIIKFIIYKIYKIYKKQQFYL